MADDAPPRLRDNGNVEQSSQQRPLEESEEKRARLERSPGNASHVFVFDYDHTIVCENSDTYIPDSLQAQRAIKLFEEFYKGEGPSKGWTALMDSVVVACQSDDGRTIEEITEKAKQVPCFPELIQVLNLVADKGPVHIVSDANSLFIQSFLDHHKVRIDHVHTNPAKKDEQTGLLRVHAHSIQFPHTCTRCPKNMCKSSIVSEHILPKHEPSRPKIVYFGDGSNDFCPVLNVLSENDVVFARDDPAEPRARGLIKRIEQHPAGVKAQVHRWAKGKDLLELVKRHLL